MRFPYSAQCAWMILSFIFSADMRTNEMKPIGAHKQCAVHEPFKRFPFRWAARICSHNVNINRRFYIQVFFFLCVSICLYLMNEHHLIRIWRWVWIIIVSDNIHKYSDRILSFPGSHWRSPNGGWITKRGTSISNIRPRPIPKQTFASPFTQLPVRSHIAWFFHYPHFSHNRILQYSSS